MFKQDKIHVVIEDKKTEISHQQHITIYCDVSSSYRKNNVLSSII